MVTSSPDVARIDADGYITLVDLGKSPAVAREPSLSN
jgi:hypothetical protein